MSDSEIISNQMRWIPDPPLRCRGMNTGMRIKPVSSIKAVPVHAIETGSKKDH